jgi:hypothetical protein
MPLGTATSLEGQMNLCPGWHKTTHRPCWWFSTSLATTTGKSKACSPCYSHSLTSAGGIACLPRRKPLACISKCMPWPSRELLVQNSWPAAHVLMGKLGAWIAVDHSKHCAGQDQSWWLHQCSWQKRSSAPPQSCELVCSLSSTCSCRCRVGLTLGGKKTKE